MAVADDPVEESSFEQRDLAVSLSQIALFAEFDAATLRAIAEQMQWLVVPSGSRLFAAGEPADGLYAVLSGSLGAFAIASDAEAAPELVGRIGAFETVGELALLTHAPRNATVVALRDSEVGYLPQEVFDRFFRVHPGAMASLARLTAKRLEAAHSNGRARPSAPRVFMLLPNSLEVDIAGVAVRLVAELGRYGRTELIWNARGDERTSQWFHNVETANHFLVYVADHAATSWTQLCRRQSDLTVIVAGGGEQPGAVAKAEIAARQGARRRRVDVALLHDGGIAPGAAARWLALDATIAHHHLLTDSEIARLARSLTGNSVGVVMSGGGARGFAHIGALRALRESGLTIDAIGGTSIGAIMAAGAASSWPYEEMLERFRRTFVATNPLDDYTLPLVSLVAGRKVTRLLRQEFGEICIEDLPLPFFAVSSNLTTGRAHVHQDGLLWRALRASIAIPGVMPPVFTAGHVLVDGGAINNLPVDVMRGFGHGRVIGIDVGADQAFTTDFDDVEVPPFWRVWSWFRAKRRRVNILQILWRSGMVNSAATSAVHRESSDLLVRPSLGHIDMLNWRAYERAIEVGYQHTRELLERLPADLPASGRVAIVADKPGA